MVSNMLLETKLHIPPTRSAIVQRPRLVAKLNDGLTRKLILVSAPAGSGKTTLLASWVQQKKTAGAWLSLDKGDNELVRFWTYLIAALQSDLPKNAQQYVEFISDSIGIPINLISVGPGREQIVSM